MKGKTSVLIIILLISILLASIAVSAQTATAKEGFQQFVGSGNIWEKIKYIFGGQWIKTQLDFVATMRIFFFFFVFTVSYAALHALGNRVGQLNWLTGRTAGIIAFIISAIGTLFMPLTLLITMGADYAILAALIFMAPFIGLLIWLAWFYWGRSRWVSVIALVVLLFVYLFIVYMVGLVEGAFATGNFKGPLQIIAIPLIPRLKWE